MAGLLTLWLVTEEVCPKFLSAYIALLIDNLPTVGWVKLIAERGSLVAIHLVQALLLRLKKSGASPLKHLDIAGG